MKYQDTALQCEAIEFLGQLCISNPCGLYVEVPDWPTHPGLYLDLAGSRRVPTKRVIITNEYDDQSICPAPGERSVGRSGDRH